MLPPGVQSGTGVQKLAEVMLLTEQAVTALLAKAGIAANTGYIQSVVSAVVAILNVQQAQSPAVDGRRRLRPRRDSVGGLMYEENEETVWRWR